MTVKQNESAAVLEIGVVGQLVDLNKGSQLDSLIAAGSAKLSTAQSIIDIASNSDALKAGKDLIAPLLAPAKDVLAILNVVSTIHPAVQVAVGVFSVLVKLEMDRRDNDKQIAILYHTMSDLLFVLSYLDPVFNSVDKLKSMLERQLKDITATMNSFGKSQFLRVSLDVFSMNGALKYFRLYYKHKTVVRMVMSTRYKGQLADFATNFAGQKQELQNLLVQKTSVTTTQMAGTLDNMVDKVDKIVAFLNVKTEKEKKVDSLITKEGGTEAVINNDKLLKEVADLVGEEVSTAVKYTLRTDLKAQLDANRALYDLKLDAMTAQLKDAVEKSTSMILLRLDSGPHDLIEDPDIREVWKEMAWKVSCKARHFVDALHHYFASSFGRHRLLTGEPHPDLWTLQILSKVIFYPSIGDAIDDDASGYIGIFEVNSFLRAKPAGWTTPQWIAYWGAGWYQNAVHFLNRAYESLDAVKKLAASALPQNRRYLENYTGADGLANVRVILDSVYMNNLDYHGFDKHEFHKLGELRKERMKADIKYMKERLSKPKYQLDSVEAVAGVMNTNRLEVHILTLIWLLLRRHKKILTIAKTKVLSEQEFTVMYTSWENVFAAFRFRINNLTECWRQQRLEIKTQLEWFAAGIYEGWWKRDEEDSSSSSDSSDSEDSDSDTESDDSDVPDAEDEAAGSQILVYPLPEKPDEDTTDGKEDTKPATKTKPPKPTVESRLKTVENRLESMEKTLKELVALAKKENPESTATPAPTENTASTENPTSAENPASTTNPASTENPAPQGNSTPKDASTAPKDSAKEGEESSGEASSGEESSGESSEEDAAKKGSAKKGAAKKA